MRVRNFGLATLLMLTLAVVAPKASWAQAITVDVGPGICSLSGNSPLNFPNPWPCNNANITITPKGAGSANVSVYDGNLDLLKFLNATITANTACTPPPGGSCNAVEDLHIVVTREFIPGPSTTAAAVYYKTSASGDFSTINVGNVVTVKSTVTEVASSTTQQMLLQQDPDNNGNGKTVSLPTAGTPNTQWIVPPHLSGNRILKLDFWFTLKSAGDKLSLASVVLENKSTADPGDGGEGEDRRPGGGTGGGGTGGETR